MKFHQIQYITGQQFLLKYPKVQRKFKSDLVLFEVTEVHADMVHFKCTNVDGYSQYLYTTRDKLNNPKSNVEVCWVKHSGELPKELFEL